MGLEKITMPQLGESVTEGTISQWLVSVGTKVNKYDPLAEVITDKVTAEVPSTFSGVIKEIIVEEGKTVGVGETLCTIETETSEQVVAENKIEVVTTDVVEEVKSEPQKKRYSPAVLRLSQEHDVDLSKIIGTGKSGRITRKDVLHYIEKRKEAGIKEESVASDTSTVQKPVKTDASLPEEKEIKPVASTYSTKPGDVEIPVNAVRKAIATNMIRSKQEIPHAWMMVEVDVTNLVQYRDEIKDEFLQKEGFKLTYFPFFVKAVAQALKEFPQINSMWAGDKIIQKKDINLSVAVATEDALFTPVVKHADEKTIKGIAREITELTEKVRTGKLSSEDLQGGTFTVNNTGSFGSIQSMGVINYPQAAILQVETIVKRPVVMSNGMIAVRDMVNLCLSLDHRVLDGLICGIFLKRVKEILENMTKENTSIY
ncbi:dihydrolipoamide acetyltransferase family protein [Pallidibacillus pasinlerensis]|uniref:Dihydrolipoamide acetyltransferase component of pyruvate dehydrogenase complex n=1 Tax=Pallidibacillus pasinlerensis TaxID=2703818 RepID=A0ABX0A6G5_9BACI|nr:dihydrolipoamide acetyltransferase family protein [Pallidibacillus pasinlerensis]NCU16762.1 2-oxo acid dehydrogenase subunit E2 [Pallidibacillus pasinlerensis]